MAFDLARWYNREMSPQQHVLRDSGSAGLLYGIQGSDGERYVSWVLHKRLTNTHNERII